MTLQLPNVTVELVDVDCPELARLSMLDTLSQIEPGEAIIFSPTFINVPGARWVKIPAFGSIDEYMNFLWYDLPNYICTSHALITQWDSWVTDASRWTDEFLHYDYGGAPWKYKDAYNVGNGSGLRSSRLMRYLRSDAGRKICPLTNEKEDHLLSRIYRTKLQQQGFTWMPSRLASRLSFEMVRPSDTSKHFMFHDAFNFPAVLGGDKLKERLDLMKLSSRGLRKLGEIEVGRKAEIDRGLW